MVNIDLGEGRLYPDSAPRWTAAQVEAYLAHPDRLPVADPGLSRPSHAVRDMRPLLDGWLADRGMSSLPSLPVARPAYAFVIGIGLGHHLPALVESNLARHLVLVEPVAEFLLHSLGAIDWEALFLAAEARGMTLHWVVGLTPEETARAFEVILFRTRGAGRLDGAHAYLHYPSWATRTARALLNERIGNYLVLPNAFDDEILMLRNAYGNLLRRPFRHLDGRERPALDIPTLIVGSGPSLDQGIEHVARLRDRALVISCGSALGILLKRGIRPDFHVENENAPPLARNLETFRAEHGLQGIRLLASLTVDPAASALFEDRWFYHRALSSPAAVLSDGWPALGYTGPLAANAGVAAAIALGLSDLYLFGVDCGRRPGAGHHARDAIYNRPGYDNFIAGDSRELLEKELVMEVPGNFGGTVEASPAMDLSRRTFAELLRAKSVSCVNCSDGARIEGAKPRAASSVVLDYLPGRQAEAIRLLEARTRPFPAGLYLTGAPVGRVMVACDAFREALPRAVAAAGDVQGMEANLIGLREQHIDVLDGVWKMIGGSLSLMLRMAAWREARIADPETRRAFLAVFRAAFVAAGDKAARDARELLGMIRDRQPEEAIAGRFADDYPLSRHV